MAPNPALSAPHSTRMKRGHGPFAHFAPSMRPRRCLSAPHPPRIPRGQRLSSPYPKWMRPLQPLSAPHRYSRNALLNRRAPQRRSEATPRKSKTALPPPKTKPAETAAPTESARSAPPTRADPLTQPALLDRRDLRDGDALFRQVPLARLEQDVPRLVRPLQFVATPHTTTVVIDERLKTSS